MHVEITDRPALHVAGLRHRGPYAGISEVFAQLGQRLGAHARDYFQRGATMVALYHDDPQTVPADQLRSDAAIVIPSGLPVPAGLVDQRVPAGQYACTLHVGPYERLPLRGEWLPASGWRPGDGPSYEVYLNNPMTTPKEALKTEVCVPVQR
jgi:AraC family transcriptional regulator